MKETQPGPFPAFDMMRNADDKGYERVVPANLTPTQEQAIRDLHVEYDENAFIRCCAEFKRFQGVQVIRSSGKAETNWTISGFELLGDGDIKVFVMQAPAEGQPLIKAVSLSLLRMWQN